MRREKTSTTTRTCMSPGSLFCYVTSDMQWTGPPTSFGFSQGPFLSISLSFFLSWNGNLVFHRVQLGPNWIFCGLVWTHVCDIFYKLGHGVEQEFQWLLVKWLNPMAEPIEANLASSWGKNGRPDSPPPIPRKSLVRLFSTLFEPRWSFNGTGSVCFPLVCIIIWARLFEVLVNELKPEPASTPSLNEAVAIKFSCCLPVPKTWCSSFLLWVRVLRVVEWEPDEFITPKLLPKKDGLLLVEPIWAAFCKRAVADMGAAGLDCWLWLPE